MRRRWTCARWLRAGSSSGLALVALAAAGCGGEKPRAIAQGLGALPKVRTVDACPVSRPGATSPDFAGGLGRGPAYPVGGFRRGAVLELAPPHNFDSRAWAGQKVLWVQSPGAPKGLVVRGRRLDGAGEVRFDDGDVPADRLVLPEPDPDGWVDRPGYTRLRSGGCYAYVVQGPDVRRVIVFRAVRLAHFRSPGDRTLGVSAQQLERAIVEPRHEGNDLAVPSEASCRAPTARERRRNPFGDARRVFSCEIADQAGTHRYDVQVLANWCYVASLQRRRGEHTRGIMACR